MTELSFFATAPNGMADLLAEELRQIGASEVKETRAGVSFQGSIETAYRVCLWSRLANRVLMPLASFTAESPEALYDGVKAINWSQHLDARQTLAVDANVSSSNITHSHFAALKIKDAIVDTFMEKDGIRPSVEVDQPDIQVNAYIQRNETTVYLDLSGASLHQRNYRLETGEAPLKENLAAAILMRARWQEMAAEQGAFVDLMCGSGTLVIEAALMAADIAPALQREYFGFLRWKKHNDAVWQRLLSEATYRKQQGLEKLPVMMGFDADKRMIPRAQANAERAGVGDRLRFVYQDVFNFRHDLPPKGLVVTNPPYGRRLSESGELPSLYRALGDVMKRHFVGWRAAVFTEEQALGKHIGMRAQRVHTLYNGAVTCKLIHFNIEEADFYRDDRLPRAVAAEDLSEQSNGFRNRLTKNLKEIGKWARRENVSCYRVYDADLPDYAAAIDLYSHVSDPREQWICIQEYEAPATIDPAKARLRTRELVTVCREVFEVQDDHLFYKTRARQRGSAQYERVEHTRNFHKVTEGLANLWVNFEDYLDTGLFLDHRPLRLRLAEESSGKAVLNLFCYTGAATVHAALGGAASTVSVDMSKTYLDWAGRNLELNDQRRKHHQLVHADCMSWLEEQARAGGERFDLVFLDPPTFSNSKRMSETFDVQRDQDVLVGNALRLVNEGGVLYFSTNRRGFVLSDTLQQHNPVDITPKTIPHDFRRSPKIHQCWMFHG